MNIPKQVSFNYKDPAITRLLRRVKTFKELTTAEIKSLASILKKWQYDENEIVCREGHVGSTAYIVEEGEFYLDIMDRGIKTFYKGDFFGEIALVDAKPRMGTIRAIKKASLFSIDESDQRIICEGFSRDIRGAQPNNLDIMLAHLIKTGKSQVMPAVLTGKEYNIPFQKIDTDNTVSPELASLANRLIKE